MVYRIEERISLPAMAVAGHSVRFELGRLLAEDGIVEECGEPETRGLFEAPVPSDDGLGRTLSV